MDIYVLIDVPDQHTYMYQHTYIYHISTYVCIYVVYTHIYIEYNL